MNISTLINELINKLEGWAEAFVLMLPNFAIAILIIALFWGISKVANTAVARLIQRFSNNRAIKKLGGNITSIVILSIGLFMALSVLELDKAVTSLLAGAGVVGLAIGFAFQDLSANFISGLMIGFRKPYSIGDHVRSNGLEGIIKDVSLRNTVIKTFQGQEVLIPNKEVYQNPLINFTTTGERRIDLEVGVSYADDLEKVKKITLDAISGINGACSKKEPQIFFTEFGGSSINLTANFWINPNNQPGFLSTRSNAIIAIKKAYDKAGITIPFPIRTLDFGIEGGENLKSMLQKRDIEPGASSRS